MRALDPTGACAILWGKRGSLIFSEPYQHALRLTPKLRPRTHVVVRNIAIALAVTFTRWVTFMLVSAT
ncbi:MAG: hypothetical protein KC543_06730 [Myxococcales bacterium]|nr:hypothetical protein [Myxococcales bacterium]